MSLKSDFYVSGNENEEIYYVPENFCIKFQIKTLQNLSIIYTMIHPILFIHGGYVPETTM